MIITVLFDSLLFSLHLQNPAHIIHLQHISVWTWHISSGQRVLCGTHGFRLVTSTSVWPADLTANSKCRSGFNPHHRKGFVWSHQWLLNLWTIAVLFSAIIQFELSAISDYIHLLIWYMFVNLYCVYYAPGTALGARNTLVTKTNANLCPRKLTFLWGWGEER